MTVRAALRVDPAHLIAKTCATCHRFLGHESFGMSGGRIRSSCKECMNVRARGAQTRERRARDSERRRTKQAITRATADNEQRRWREDELRVLADTSLSEMEQAAALGRSHGAIQAARKALRAGELSAYETPHGYDRYRLQGCRCDDCRAAATAHGREQGRRRQDETRDTAQRSGQPWTGPELEVLATRVGVSMTVREFALRYERTWRATSRMREKVLHDPKWRKVAGVDDA